MHTAKGYILNELSQCQMSDTPLRHSTPLRDVGQTQVNTVTIAGLKVTVVILHHSLFHSALCHPKML